MILQTNPSKEVCLPLPANLKSEDANLFPSHTRFTFPETFVRVVDEVDIHPRGPARLTDGQYLIESFVGPAHLERWLKKREHWRLGMERLIQRQTRLDGQAVWIVDNWSCGYFHWMCDALPRLELALGAVEPKDTSIVLPHKFSRAQYFRESLEAFGLSNVQVLDRWQRVRCRRLVVPSHVGSTGIHDPEIIGRMRDRFRSFAKTSRKNSKTPSRIYISRRMANRRHVANEEEILPVLKKHGFEIMVAEPMSWAEQIRMLMDAEMLISNHGAGLSNMMVMNPGCQVMEIRAREDSHNGCYQMLAAASGLSYFYLLADPVRQSQSVHWAHVHVDPQSLDLAIGQMIDRKSTMAA